MQTTMHCSSVAPGQSCSYATRSMSAHRLGGRVNLGSRTNGFRAVRAQKRQRLGASNRSGLNIVCEKVCVLHELAEGIVFADSSGQAPSVGGAQSFLALMGCMGLKAGACAGRGY